MKMQRFVLVFMLGCLSSTDATAQQPIRQTIPDEHPGPPYYARGLVDPNIPLVPVVFYRPPAKVPSDFNLLSFFDVPRALSVGPLQVTGFHIVKGPIPPLGTPILQNLSGNAVPIWFVNLPVLLDATSDSVLTIDELREIIIHQGVATSFREVLQPTGGAVVSNLTIVARGELDDGRMFALTFVGASGAVNLPPRLQLSIK